MKPEKAENKKIRVCDRVLKLEVIEMYDVMEWTYNKKTNSKW